METILLHQANLQQIGTKLAIPEYDRSKLGAGILHVGMGNFHRSHQAYCLHKYIQEYQAYEWGICAVGLVPYDESVYKSLLSQNGLYSLTIKKEDGKI